MPEEVLLLFARHGCVRRRALVSAGLSRRRIAGLVQRGQLRLLAPDVLALPGPPAVDEELRAAAAGLGGVVSGRSAALVRGWALLDAPAAPELTVARDRGSARRAGIRLYRRDLDPADVDSLDGLPVTGALRTVLDCCRDLPLRDAVVVADSALRARDVSLPQLQAALVDVPAGRGRARIARALALADPLSGSVLESACRLVLVGGGLTPEATQLVVRAGRRTLGRFDFAWPSAKLVVETDGFAFHASRASYREDRRRTNALVREGWSVLRFSWEDVLGSPDYVTACVRDVLLAAGRVG